MWISCSLSRVGQNPDKTALLWVGELHLKFQKKMYENLLLFHNANMRRWTRFMMSTAGGTIWYAKGQGCHSEGHWQAGGMSWQESLEFLSERKTPFKNRFVTVKKKTKKVSFLWSTEVYCNFVCNLHPKLFLDSINDILNSEWDYISVI